MRFIKWILALLAIVGGLAWTVKEELSDFVESTRVPCEQMLYDALLDRRESVYLGGYGLSEKELAELWEQFQYYHGELFYVDNEYEYSYINNRVASVKPRYEMDGEALAQAQMLYTRALDDIAAYYDPNWTPVQTALFFHDYLCMHFKYDDSLSRFSAYEMLRDGSGVCQAYTIAYMTLLNRFGVECGYVVSKGMNHSWNVVTIDGQKYNVDVTYDDPSFDRLGRASHANFLLSDAALSKNHSFSPEEGYGQCTDTRFDSGAVWENVSTGFVPVGDAFYFIRNGNLYSWDGATDRWIDSITATWFTENGDGSYWRGNHSTMWWDGDLVLYSKPDLIMGYAPATGQFSRLYDSPYADDIYGFTYDDGVLVLQLGKTPNEPGRTETLSVRLE